MYWAPRQMQSIWGATSIYITENVWGTDIASGGAPEVVEQATHSVPPDYRRQRPWGGDGLSARQRRAQLERPVRPSAVVVVHVLAQSALQRPRSQDEQPVQAVAARGAHPPLGERVRPRGPHRRAHHPDGL